MSGFNAAILQPHDNDVVAIRPQDSGITHLHLVAVGYRIEVATQNQSGILLKLQPLPKEKAS